MVLHQFHFKICSIGQYCRNDYSFYAWAEQNGKIIGGEENVSAKINRFDLATHNSEPFVLYGEVYYQGKCPFCEEDERKEEEVKEAIEDLKRMNTVEKEELLREMNEKIMKLTVERDFLAAKLADATSELEKWKANDRKNDKIKKLENAFAQLNAKVSGLACNSSLHNQ
ncbi:hypothetical protein M3Y95_01204000 [Aphelenchoides besseyi]|nr:hypothetical protein M3Y95_01204000 [Aphelenchoides besseyi]